MARARRKAAAGKKASARSPRAARPARRARQILQFKITLEGIAPPIWRRIQVPAEYTFWDLHVAIQDAMGWDDSHLHQFVFHGEDESSYVYLGIPEDEGIEEEAEVLAGWEYRVFDQLEQPGDQVIYEYDLGDSWEHAVLLEAILPPARGGRYPRCIAGERACPPEDCGGAVGYDRLLAVLRDPRHDDHQDLLAWIGAPYDPESFHPGQVKFHDPRRRLQAILGTE